MAKKPVALACDHAGLPLKNFIKERLTEKGVEFVDFGTDTDVVVDYPDYAKPACDAVVDGRCECALLFCGTGVGISIAANKVKGIRACCCSDVYSAEMTRGHNDANALCMGARVVGSGLAEMMVDAFLNTGFDGGIHTPRLEKVKAIENGTY